MSASEDFRVHDSTSTALEAVFILPQKPQIAPKTPQIAPSRGDCEQYRHIVEMYDWNTEVMMKVMSLESSCVPTAVGDTKPIRGVLAPSCGLFQVRTIDPARGTCKQLKDPSFNVQKAYEIYKSQGLRAWSVTHNW